MDEHEFKLAALALFPDLQESFEELDGLFHLQMEQFERRTNEEISRRNEDNVLAAFQLAERCWKRGSDVMQNAIETSFAEGITRSNVKHGAWAWKLLPKPLKVLHVNFWGEESVKTRLGLQRLY